MPLCVLKYKVCSCFTQMHSIYLHRSLDKGNWHHFKIKYPKYLDYGRAMVHLILCFLPFVVSNYFLVLWLLIWEVLVLVLICKVLLPITHDAEVISIYLKIITQYDHLASYWERREIVFRSFSDNSLFSLPGICYFLRIQWCLGCPAIGLGGTKIRNERLNL